MALQSAATMLYQSTVKPVRSSSTRRLRLTIIALVLLCSFYWVATRTSSTLTAPSLQDGTRREAAGAQDASDKKVAGSNWRLRDSNGRSRKMEAALQAPVPEPTPTRSKATIQKDLIVASMIEDDTSWLYESLPDWHKSIYVVDDDTADLTVANNKGRESMVYLTYGPTSLDVSCLSLRFQLCS